ncbi:MAG: trypsin-like peptidase domain-containing protein [Pirellulales bacterium]
MEYRSPFDAQSNTTTDAQPVVVVFAWSSLIWGVVALVALVITLVSLPTVVEGVASAIHRGPEKAAAEAAREALTGVNAKTLSAGFELIPKAVAPSVVHINVLQRQSNLPDEIAQLMPQRELASQGSGVIVDPAGYIVTNFHVVHGATKIEVKLSDGSVFTAAKIGADPLFDLAVLKIDASRQLTAVPWGNSDDLVPGSLVWALGSPFGLDHTVTFGIVSATERGAVAGNPFQKFLQTDAAVNPGNSGGPLVNVKGELVGINTAIVGPSFQGISFSLPSNKAREVYEELKANGTVARGWLGVRTAEVTPDVADSLALPDRSGVLIEAVFRDTPAAAGGLRPADVIVKWNGIPTPDPRTLIQLVAETDIGAKVDVEVYRRGKLTTLSITVEQRPNEF